MAIEKGLEPLSYPASADMSTRQYRCVNLASDGEVQAATAGAYVLGIQQNKPAAVGRATSVQTKAGAVTKINVSTTATAAITANSALIAGTSTVAAVVSGFAVAASTGGTAYVWGRAIEGLSTGLTGVISATITHEGPTSTA